MGVGIVSDAKIESCERHIMTASTESRPATADYAHPINARHGTLMTVKAYLEDVASGMLMDDDGMGDVVKDGFFAKPDAGDDGWPRWVSPSDGTRFIPLDATHILWYSK